MQPDPHDWFDDLRLARLQVAFRPALPSLATLGVLPVVIEAWIRSELANSVPWGSGEREALAQQAQAQLVKKGDQNLDYLDWDSRIDVLSQHEGSLRWAKEQWQPRLHTIFLEKKTELDEASCYLLKVEDEGTAFELYHRLKAHEITIESLAFLQGIDHQLIQESYFSRRPVNALPYSLADIIHKLTPGEPAPPCKLKSKMAIFYLESYWPVEYDDRTERVLLKAELKAWLAACVSVAIQSLQYLTHQSPLP